MLRLLRRPLAVWWTEGRVALNRLVTQIRRLALRPLSLLLAKPPEAAQQAPALLVSWMCNCYFSLLPLAI